MREAIQLLLAIARIVPLEQVLALIKAASPVPTNWRDKLELTAWLQRIGIVDPSAAVVVETVCEKVALMQSESPYFSQSEVEAMVEQEVLQAGIDPATIAMLVQVVIQILKALGVLKS